MLAVAPLPDPALRVLHVVCTDAFAGVERYVSTLAAAQAELGWSVAVIGGSPELMPAALGDRVTWRRGTTWPIAAWHLMAQRPADIVHAHMTAAELAAVVTAPLLRAPVIATRHFARRRGSRFPALSQRVMGRMLAGQIAISHVVADQADGASQVIYTGTPEVEAPAPETRRLEVLVLQRLEAEKRTDLALEVWQRSGLGAKGWTLRIAGEGSQEQALRDLAVQLGVDESTEFLGYRDDALALLERSSILLAPCPNDGLGLAVVEAMAVGLPIVAAAAGGHLETVGAHPDAALFAVDDLDGGAALLRRLAEDSDYRLAYGHGLQQLQRQQFSLARQVADTTSFYRAILASSEQRPGILRSGH